MVAGQRNNTALKIVSIAIAIISAIITVTLAYGSLTAKDQLHEAEIGVNKKICEEKGDALKAQAVVQEEITTQVRLEQKAQGKDIEHIKGDTKLILAEIKELRK